MSIVLNLDNKPINKCAPTSPGEIKCHIDGVWGFGYHRLPRVNALSSLEWCAAAKKTLKQTSSPQFIVRMSVRASHVPFPTSFKPWQKGASSHPDWLGGKCPKLLPLLNQESVSTSLLTGDLNPLQSVLRGFWKNRPKPPKKERKQVSNSCTATTCPKHNDQNYPFPRNSCVFRNVVAFSCFSPSGILNFSSNFQQPSKWLYSSQNVELSR